MDASTAYGIVGIVSLVIAGLAAIDSRKTHKAAEATLVRAEHLDRVHRLTYIGRTLVDVYDSNVNVPSMTMPHLKLQTLLFALTLVEGLDLPKCVELRDQLARIGRHPPPGSPLYNEESRLDTSALIDRLQPAIDEVAERFDTLQAELNASNDTRS